jgi:hypothetical protein
MSLWWVLTPLFLLGLLLALAYLEDAVVAPIDREVRVRALMESTPPDEIERQVASMFAQLTNRTDRDDRAAARPRAHQRRVAT